jgi:hypothetical protein
MSAENIDNPISYEQLEDLEDDFEQVELELRKFYLCYHLTQTFPFLLSAFWRQAVEHASFRVCLLELRDPQMSISTSSP